MRGWGEGVGWRIVIMHKLLVQSTLGSIHRSGQWGSRVSMGRLFLCCNVFEKV